MLDTASGPAPAYLQPGNDQFGSKKKVIEYLK